MLSVSKGQVDNGKLRLREVFWPKGKDIFAMPNTPNSHFFFLKCVPLLNKIQYTTMQYKCAPYAMTVCSRMQYFSFVDGQKLKTRQGVVRASGGGLHEIMECAPIQMNEHDL